MALWLYGAMALWRYGLTVIGAQGNGSSGLKGGLKFYWLAKAYPSVSWYSLRAPFGFVGQKG
jgi:hypothetical protein